MKIHTIAVLAALLTTTAAAHATDFAAAPLNPGPPTNLPGETLIPGVPQVLQVINGATQPILQPLLAPTAVASAEPVGAIHHGRHRHHAQYGHHARYSHYRPGHHALHGRRVAKRAWHRKPA